MSGRTRSVLSTDRFTRSTSSRRCTTVVFLAAVICRRPIYLVYGPTRHGASCAYVSRYLSIYIVRGFASATGEQRELCILIRRRIGLWPTWGFAALGARRRKPGFAKAAHVVYDAAIRRDGTRHSLLGGSGRDTLGKTDNSNTFRTSLSFSLISSLVSLSGRAGAAAAGGAGARRPLSLGLTV